MRGGGGNFYVQHQLLRGVITQGHLSLLSKRNLDQTVEKLPVSFLGQRMRPMVYAMSFPGSRSRKGVRFSMSVLSGGGGGVIQKGSYSTGN